MSRPSSLMSAQSIVGIIATLGFASLPISKWENEFASVGHLIGYEIIWWAMVVFVLSYVRFVEKRPLASVGFRAMQKLDVVIAIAAAVVMLAGLAAIYYVVFPRLGVTESQQVNRLLATPLWWRAISVIRAAVSEEVLFRGYAIERLKDISASLTIAAVISGVVFTVAHVGPWGWGHLLLAGYVGIVLTALYVWRRNLWANIVAHEIVDGAAVLSS